MNIKHGSMKNKIIIIFLSLAVFLSIFFLYKKNIEEEARMKYAEQCLHIIMNGKLNKYQELIFPPTKEILIKKQQYQYFLSQFDIARTFKSVINDSEWDISIKSINKYPPLSTDVGTYALMKMPMPDFLMTFSAKQGSNSYAFKLYGKNYGDKNYLVFPVLEE